MASSATSSAARRLHGKVHRIFRKEELHLLPALIAAADLGLHAADNFADLLKRIGDLADLMRAAVAQALCQRMGALCRLLARLRNGGIQLGAFHLRG